MQLHCARAISRPFHAARFDPHFTGDRRSLKRATADASALMPMLGKVNSLTSLTSASSSIHASLPGVPEPKPLFEIWVYSPRLKACTCAAARWRGVACAGPTAAKTSAPKFWALVKAQQVKNTVIVPVGSKGGFV
jgi:hypothetical protein